MILVSHIDLDGVGCAIVAKIFYPGIKIYHQDYDFIDEKVCSLLKNTSKKIIITDLSVSKEVAEFIQEKYSQRVHIYDHHKTAQEYLDQYSWTTYDITVSATKLFLQECKKNMPETKIPAKLDKFVERVNDYDLWIHQYKDTIKYNDMFNLLGMELFTDAMYNRLINNQALIQQSDMFYLRGLWQTKQKYYKKALKTSIVDGDRLIVQATRYISELSQYIRDIQPVPEEWKNIKYIDIINVENNGHSLRSYDLDFDVSEIAKANNGGGHPRAAGYPFQVSTEEWIKKL
ncbi:MAG TPA: hypothetical protein P5543_06300 [Planctomycetota bacterium]|mgnify:FL=1|nr:hypothetical protein [Planctomycetota bacterium]